MADQYLLKHTTTTEFRGQKHTIHSEVEPVFTGDEEETFRWIAEAQARASRVLNGIEESSERSTGGLCRCGHPQSFHAPGLGCSGSHHDSKSCLTFATSSDAGMSSTTYPEEARTDAASSDT